MGDFSTIYIIRHGEKSPPSIGCLSDEGILRSKNLLNIFDGNSFEKPDYIFTCNYSDILDCERCIQLGVPLAKHLNIKINKDYGYWFWKGGDNKIAEEVLDIISKKNVTILIIWEHENIHKVCKYLGQTVPEWDDDDYDSIYKFQIKKNKEIKSFLKTKQNFIASKELLNSKQIIPTQGQKTYKNNWNARIFIVSIVLIRNRKKIKKFISNILNYLRSL
jgi:hypothetical protein